MKLVRFGPPGKELPGAIDQDGKLHDLSAVIADVAAANLAPEALERLRGLSLDALPAAPEGCRLGPCVGGTTKVIGVGMNYHDHLAQTGRPVPEFPVLFAKPTSSLSGADDPIPLPEMAGRLDWEVELGVVIGTRTWNVAPEDALDRIAGYCVVNDLTERGWIERSGQLFDGKGGDGFTPVGPWLVTKDEIPNPQDLALFLDLNGKRMQAGSTADMIFDLPTLISHISRLTTLLPGDIIATGTPAGVGMRQTPPLYLKIGDEMQLGISGLGVQRQRVIAHPGQG